MLINVRLGKHALWPVSHWEKIRVEYSKEENYNLINHLITYLCWYLINIVQEKSVHFIKIMKNECSVPKSCHAEAKKNTHTYSFLILLCQMHFPTWNKQSTQRLIFGSFWCARAMQKLINRQAAGPKNHTNHLYAVKLDPWYHKVCFILDANIKIYSSRRRSTVWRHRLRAGIASGQWRKAGKPNPNPNRKPDWEFAHFLSSNLEHTSTWFNEKWKNAKMDDQKKRTVIISESLWCIRIASLKKTVFCWDCTIANIMLPLTDGWFK